MEDERKTKKQLIKELNCLRLEQIEQSRVTSEKFTKAFLQNSIPTTITTVKDGIVIDASDAFLRLVGLKRHEVIGHTSTEGGFLTIEQRVSFFNELKKSGRIENLELEIRPSDGTLRYGLFNAVLMSINNENYLLTNIQDITERKQAEKELRESQDKFHTIFDSAPLGIFRSTPAGKFIEVNPTLAKMLGYDSPEAVIKNISNIATQIYVRSADRQPIVDKQLQLSGITQHYNHYRRADGTEFFANLYLKTIRDEEGQPLYLEGIVEDITERKRAESQREAALEALREREVRLLGIIEKTQAGYFYINIDGLFEMVNPAWMRMHGYDSPEEVIGKHFAITQVKDDLKTAKQNVDELLAGLPVPTGEFTRRCKDGSIGYHTFSANPVVQDGKIVGLEGFIIDTTAQKQVEDKIKIIVNELKEAQRLAQVGSWNWVAKNDTVTWSEELYRIAGRDPSLPALSYQEHPILYTPESMERLDKAVQLSMKTGTPYEIEMELIRMDNRTSRMLVARGETLRDEIGSIIGLHGTVQDITERKQAEVEKAVLEAQNRQLQKTESLGRMAGAIAHHFNNQLGAVIGNLEMAMDELPKGASTHQTLTKAMQSAWTAADMSGLMLTYLGQTHEKVDSLDLSYFCRKILPLIKSALPENVVMESDFPLPRPIIMANAGEIQQILNNLITNSREAIGNNSGTISLSVKTVSPAEIPTAHLRPIGWQPQNNAYACLEVTDTGCGIEDKAIEQLFDPFFTDKFTGRGMGLPVVLGIVKAYKGAITVDTKPGRGSTFRIFFSVSEEAMTQPQTAENDRDVTTGSPSSKKFEEGGTVLVVEDEEMLRNMAGTMLESFGFTVLKAKDGIEALEIFRKHQSEIKFVLTDLTMPRMNGWETLTALRKLQPGIPVILASGYDLAHVMEGDHPELPQAFLAKPYNLKALRAAISQTLSNKKK